MFLIIAQMGKLVYRNINFGEGKFFLSGYVANLHGRLTFFWSFVFSAFFGFWIIFASIPLAIAQ
jgi:hypothetical protein